MQRLLSLPYEDRPRALREIAELAASFPPAIGERFASLLASSPAPELGLRYFARLREQQCLAFERLTRSGAGLRHLIAIFTYSHFLSEEIIEHPDAADELRDSSGLQRVLTKDALRRRLENVLPSGVPHPLELAKFRRRQLLRILVRDVLGLGTLPEIVAELSELADVVVETAYERIYEELVSRYGVPRSEEGGSEAHFAVIALGKLGGKELNYSSDIDLMFLYSQGGYTDGAESITNKEFFKRAANQLTQLLSTYTAEGMCYRVDLRLRPDGKLGEVCLSLDGAREYYQRRGRDWELQMLIKARVAAGHAPTGRALLEFVEPLTYSTTLDFSLIEQLSLTRERWNEKLAAKKIKRGNSIDVKLERGGIRDIEFLVQCLQRLYGGTYLWLRHGGTMMALARLQNKGYLSGAEYGRLATAYQFLRHLEHRLQFEDDLQTHMLPDDPAARELLARRMPGGGSAEWLLNEIEGHFESVRDIYDRVVYARTGPAELRGTGDPVAGLERGPERGIDVSTQPPTSSVVLALEQRAPAVAAALARAGLRRGYRAFEHFLERLPAARLEQINSNSEWADQILDIFEHSPYFGEEFIRNPELVSEIVRATTPLYAEEPAPEDMSELRRWFRRGITRIEAESICGSHPVFDTLSRTSELADAVIARAYQIAIAETRAIHPPQDASYDPRDQMWVIALGRLGMREFDLASDADLVFVLADTDAAELQFWTRVAERLVDTITAYTGGGVLFAVDTRLRPNGGAGPLVQIEGTVRDYFANTALAWEGITYMKTRAVAGNPVRAEIFLHQLQEADWKHYGHSGRSREDLRQMRLRLENEQGAAHPLKAGRGGYYDIDFLLMYLRLKSAGIFFSVLNTPTRIEVLEHLGHLDHGGAKFLLDAATFYRALDHGLRMISGHAEGRLPKSEAHRETLGALLLRWTPFPLADLADIRRKTRAAFDKQFG